MEGGAATAATPHQSIGRLFLRFLKFGFLAWGGPVAQIGMIQQELVDEEKWITGERFRRVLGVYQVLPGPEAHELCVYFGMLSRGRFGGFVAGLGFMLPGFVLMFGLSWLYVQYGLEAPLARAAFATVQAAVVALVVRAVVRIGSHTLTDRWGWAIAALAAGAQLVGVHFAFPLAAGGALYPLSRSARHGWAAGLAFAVGVTLVAWLYVSELRSEGPIAATPAATAPPADPGLGTLAWSGLRSGLLTFGGAYTVIPFLQHDAVVRGGWMTEAQFLDGLALSGILPAPLIIFATFVGFLGGGAAGAFVLTAGIFAPAFAFTLVGHDALERLVHQRELRVVLDGVTAAVVGLIAATALELLSAATRDLLTAVVFAGALAALFRWKSKVVVPLVIAAAAMIGLFADG